MNSNINKVVKVEKLSNTTISKKFGTSAAKSRLKSVKEKQKESKRVKKVDWLYLDQFKFTI